VQNTLPYACLLSRRGPCTETQTDVPVGKSAHYRVGRKGTLAK
jgi:hypothetical protein